MAPALDEFLLRLRALPRPVSGIIRLRKALKILLRGFGLRCVDYRRLHGSGEDGPDVISGSPGERVNADSTEPRAQS